jgi:MarR family transcriptional regulator, organic hydroperoxide resistance regulator
MSRAATTDASLLLDNQLCFLVYRLHRGITDLYRPVLAELGLTYPQYLVMLALWEDSPLTVSQVGARLELDSGTLSPLLKRLEAAGLILRTRAKTDERSVLVSLTPAGRALRTRARRVPAQVGECLAGTVEEYLASRAHLEEMLARVDAVNRGADA